MQAPNALARAAATPGAHQAYAFAAGADDGTWLRSKVATMYTAKARATRPTSTSAALTTFSDSLHVERVHR